ncbi:MAG: hypothetical protein GY814_04175 [Gammaproteobacteria bacterium]|nr:hypothetical protein [Gammaproteobacteria bacterium]
MVNTVKKCGCCFNNPLKRDGTSQRQRLLEGLKPDFVAVDERDLSSLLLYARDYAGLLQYYSSVNSKSGDWSDFIDSDISTLVAVIQNFEYESLKKNFDQLIDNVEGKTLAEKKKLYALQLDSFFSLSKQFDGWYRGAVEGLSLYTSLKRLIDSILAQSLQSIYAQYLRAEEVSIPLEKLDGAEFSSVWKLSEVTADSLIFPTTPVKAADLAIAMDQLKAAFSDLYDALIYLVDNAPSFLEQTLETYPEHQPHMALFITFLQLFRFAQDHLNTITGRHLDFYYQQVLGLKHKPEVTDEVHLVFELAKNAHLHIVSQDTFLRADKDSQGNNVFYATDNELVVNRAGIDAKEGLKTIFVDKDENDLVKNIYAAFDADSEDGIGAAIENEQGKWLTFGGTDMPYATVGFALSSPMFFLAEGEREITISFKLDQDLSSPTQSFIADELKHNVKVYATGEKAWFQLTISSVDIQNRKVNYRLNLAMGEEPIVAFNVKSHGEGFESDYPLIKFELDNKGLPASTRAAVGPIQEISSYSDETVSFDLFQLVEYEGLVYQAINVIAKKGFRPTDFLDSHWQTIEYAYPYKYFQAMQLTGLELEVKVGIDDPQKGIKTLVLENDNGLLDPSKPFQPFAQNPKVKSRFFVGSREIFQKGVTRLSLDIEWSDLNMGDDANGNIDFKTYYSAYFETGDPVIVNADFTVDLTLLEDAEWKPSGNCIDNYLFKTFSCGDGTNQLLTRKPGLSDFKRIDTSLTQGFMALSLNHEFFHDLYPRVLTEAAIELAGPAASPAIKLPNPPYTPVINGFSVGYSALEQIDFSVMDKDDYEDRIEKIYHIGPFGTQEVFPIADDSSVKDFQINRKIVPEFTVTVKDETSEEVNKLTAEASLYIGITDLELPQNLSVLFKVAEGSENPDLEAQNIAWSYLTSQGWVDFDITEIIQDGSNGLLGSGIINFAMPKNMSNNNTLLPDKLFWIKASVYESSAAVPQLIALHTQAAPASFRNQNNSDDHLAQPLPASTISKLKSRVASIKSVNQPYVSSDGQMKESDEAFYTRISERLRHKNRAIAIFDYERMVLQMFPEIYKVKCINHSNRCSEHAPGQVRLIAVPNLRNQNAIDKLKPQISLNKLTLIANFLKNYASNFSRIAVTNPDYEEVRIDFNVFFHAGKDKGLYSTQLNDDIIKFLSPWLYDEGADLTFGGRIHRSSILNYVEEQSYVNFVTDFQLDHIYSLADGTKIEVLNVEEAVATRASSALVSVAEHAITAEDDLSGESAAGSDSEKCIPDSNCNDCFQPDKKTVIKTRPYTYIGNIRTLEFHDTGNTQPQCFLQKIAPKRRVYFRSIGDALEQGYDYCAYCFSRELPKR